MEHYQQDAIVISASDFLAYQRCPKSFDLGWLRGWSPRVDKEVVKKGSAFHLWMEAYALVAQNNSMTVKTTRTAEIKAELDAIGEASAMTPVAEAYIEHRWLPHPPCKILMVEQPLYTKVLDAGHLFDGARWRSPSVWIRTTFDLVYQDEDAWIVARDYKTFDKNVTHDVDLDFQSRIYTKVLQLHFGVDVALVGPPHDRVRFEFENVRQTPPNVVKDKSGGKWRPDECYVNVPGYYAKHELDALWAETQVVAADIVRKLRSNNPHEWYRVGLRGHSPFTCGSCFVNDLCKAEVLQDGLDDQTARMFAAKRAYTTTTLPDGQEVLTEAERHKTDEDEVKV